MKPCDSPLIVDASVLRAGTHGQAAGYVPHLLSQEVVGALAGVPLASGPDQAQVRTAAVVHRTGVGHCRRRIESHNLPGCCPFKNPRVKEGSRLDGTLRASPVGCR